MTHRNGIMGKIGKMNQLNFSPFRARKPKMSRADGRRGMWDGELFEVGRPENSTDPSESGNMVGLGRLSGRIELLPLLIGPDPNFAEGLTHNAIKGRYR